ncbi:MAG: biotin/lipoyl-containing protein, partial [Burkholderiales bacterium]
MLVEVKVPQLSESVAEATLVTWHKKPGEYVERDENLVDIETDKVVLEMPAPESGVLKEIVKGDGVAVASSEVIAKIDTEAKAPAKAPETAKQPGSAAPAQPAPQPAAEQPAAKPAPAQPAAAAAKAGAAPVMPAAQKIAAENKVDTSTISGTGRGGRVTKGDVLDRIQAPQ